MELPSFGPGDVVESGKRRIRGVLPWFPSFKCKACGIYCESSWKYDPQTVAFAAEEHGRYGEVPSWQCPNEECGKAWRRDPSPFTTDMWDR